MLAELSLVIGSGIAAISNSICETVEDDNDTTVFTLNILSKMEQNEKSISAKKELALKKIACDQNIRKEKLNADQANILDFINLPDSSSEDVSSVLDAYLSELKNRK